MFQKFIERPVLSTVISILLVIVGVLGLTKLPLERFPNIAPPSVLVSAVYPGANAETILRSVTPSLEEAINGVEAMTDMTSTASNDGTLGITVYFKQGTNPDQAAVNVQNRVSQATSQLPAEVVQYGITTTKQQNSFIGAMGIYSEDPKKYDQTFVANYAQINIIPELKRIPGVGSASIFGGIKDYSMRVWLNPGQMSTYKITPAEVMAAIQDKNLEAAPGKLGERSNEAFEYVIKYKGKLTKPEEYENIAIRANADGSVLHLKDVARVELGAYSYTSLTRLNGHIGIGIGIIQLAGSNSNDIQIAVDNLMEKAQKDFPAGIKFNNFYRTKTALDESITQVEHTLVEAFILVFLVVFIFLQDFRSTLIPAIAVPVAIIGTFFFMSVFGFSINLLTLFALVLAIGIVVDDAIVVVEAVHAKMENDKLPVKQATLGAMGEISGAIISITLVMAAVFIPVGFMKGPTGVFYRQFGYTLAIAIFISAVNALTLSPALCAIFLKDLHGVDEHGKKKSFGARFFAAFNVGFKSMTDRYVNSLKFLFRHKWITAVALIALAGSAYLIMQRTPSGFIPTEDQGFILYAVNTPPGSSLDKTHQAVAEIDSIIKADPVTDRRYNVEGLNFISNANASPYGAGFVRMKPLDERGPVKDINTISGLLKMKVAQQVKDAHAFFFTFPTIQGFGNVAGFEFALQDQTNGSMDRLSAMSNQFIGSLMQRKEIAYAFTTFASGNPQYMMDVDDNKAKQMGVSVADLMQTMQIYYGSAFVSDLNRFGKYYRVMAQADAPYRANEESLTGIYVKNNLNQQ